MVYKRFFIFIFLILGIGILGVNAIQSNSNLIAYWTLDDLSDSSGNNYFLTNYGASSSSSCYQGTCYYFDGIDNYIDTTTSDIINVTNPYTISVWVKDTGTRTTHETYLGLLSPNNLGDNELQMAILSTGVEYYLQGVSDSYWQFYGSINFPINTLVHILLTFDGTNIYIYRNGVYQDTISKVNIGYGNYISSLLLGKHARNGNFFSGYLDEVSIWDSYFTPTNVSDIYNNGITILYTPKINSTLSSIYKTNNISVDLNTISNVNMSYILNGGSETNICNDCNSTSLNFTSLNEGNNTFIWISTDENGQINNTEIILIDTINPIINNLIPSEINSHEFLGNYFSCSDINLDYCNISIDFRNITSGTNFTLSQKGNITYKIIAQDLAGNQIQDIGILFVNPFVNISIFDNKRLINLSDYYLNNVYYTTNIVQIPYYDLISDYSLDFRKSLYNLEVFNYTESDLSDFILNFNVTPGHLNIRIFDYSTKNQLFNWNIKIDKNLINYVDTNVNDDYMIYFDSDFNSNLDITIQKNGYITTQIKPYLSINSTITQDIYLIPDTSMKLYSLEVKDRTGTNYLPDVSVELYINNGLLTNYFVGQYKTESNGKIYLTLHPDYTYKVVLTKDNYIRTTEYITPSDYSSIFYMTSEVSPNYDYNYDGFTYLISKLDTSTINITNFRCYYQDSNYLINSVTCSITRSYDLLFMEELISTNSLSSSLDFSIPNTDNSRDYYINMRVIRDGITYNFYKEFRVDGINDTTSKIEYKLNQEIEKPENSYSKPFIIIFILLFFIILGSVIAGYLGSMLGLILSVSILSFYLNIFSMFWGTIITLVALVILGLKFAYGGLN